MGTLIGWKTKASVLALASRTPGGHLLYQRFQDLQARRMADADIMLSRALDMAALIRAGAGEPVGRDFVEVGTGWCPWVPLILRLSGARRVVSVDVNPWLSHKTAVGTTRALLKRAPLVAEAVGVPAESIERQLAAAGDARTLNTWLGATGIEYTTDPGGIEQARLSEQSFDGIISSNVLEHVPPDALRAMHIYSYRLLRAGGFVSHRFNPQDHFSFSDATITGANFLQYSQDQWRWWGGSGLSYHNRLRCPQHARLIQEAGFDIVHRRTRADARARAAIETGALPIHEDFAHMSATDLSDDYMWIVARKNAGH